MELEGLAVEYESDLMYYQQEAADSETEDEEDGVEPLRPLRNFPAIALITAIHTAIEVRHAPPLKWPAPGHKLQCCVVHDLASPASGPLQSNLRRVHTTLASSRFMRKAPPVESPYAATGSLTGGRRCPP